MKFIISYTVVLWCNWLSLWTLNPAIRVQVPVGPIFFIFIYNCFFFFLPLKKYSFIYLFDYIYIKFGGIAQLEERALCKRQAPGSKPGISKNLIFFLGLFFIYYLFILFYFI